MIDKRASAELSNLAQKKDEDLYIYYCQTEDLLKKIHRQDRVTNNGRNIVTFSPFEEQLFNDNIIKFILGFKEFNLQFRVVKYCTNLIASL